MAWRNAPKISRIKVETSVKIEPDTKPAEESVYEAPFYGDAGNACSATPKPVNITRSELEQFRTAAEHRKFYDEFKSGSRKYVFSESAKTFLRGIFETCGGERSRGGGPVVKQVWVNGVKSSGGAGLAGAKRSASGRRLSSGECGARSMRSIRPSARSRGDMSSSESDSSGESPPTPTKTNDLIKNRGPTNSERTSINPFSLRKKSLTELLDLRRTSRNFNFVDDSWRIMQEMIERKQEKSQISDLNKAKSNQSRAPNITSAQQARSRSASCSTIKIPEPQKTTQKSINNEQNGSGRIRCVFDQTIDMSSFIINKQYFIELYEQLDVCSTILDRVRKQGQNAPYFQKNPSFLKPHLEHPELLNQVKILALIQIKLIVDQIANNSNSNFFNASDVGGQTLRNRNYVNIAKGFLQAQNEAGKHHAQVKLVALPDWCRMLDAVKRFKRFSRLGDLNNVINIKMMGFLNQMISAVIDYKTK